MHATPDSSQAPCTSKRASCVWRFVRRFFPEDHVWKETKRETLGSYTHFGSSPMEMTTMYRIGIFETCLLTGKSRIRQINSLHRQDTPNPASEPR